MLITYSRTEVPELMRRFLERRRPGVRPEGIVPVGLEQLRARIEAFTAVGASKFVVAPLDDPFDPERELPDVADALFDLQT